MWVLATLRVTATTRNRLRRQTIRSFRMSRAVSDRPDGETIRRSTTATSSGIGGSFHRITRNEARWPGSRRPTHEGDKRCGRPRCKASGYITPGRDDDRRKGCRG
jgi:hypothetical protein